MVKICVLKLKVGIDKFDAVCSQGESCTWRMLSSCYWVFSKTTNSLYLRNWSLSECHCIRQSPARRGFRPVGSDSKYVV